MLLVCKDDLQLSEFVRLKGALASVPYGLQWGLRGGRLVVLLENALPDAPDLAPALEDPAVEYVLKDPTEREITRLFSRRDALNLAMGATGVIAGAALLGPLAIYLARPPVERSPRHPVLIGKAASIPINGAVTRVVDGEEVVIIRRGESKFHALEATCTHSRACRVKWEAKRQQLVCPCHRGVFDPQGNVVSGPPPRPLPRREVVVRDGSLYVSRTPS